MTDKMRYKCVNCGEGAGALYRTYGPSVLKLTKCEKCNGIVDKYIEYDPVIVMIDLVLISKEAQRHIIFNTDFKAYWKLLIILMMLETYGVWRNDSLFNIMVNSICDIQNNSTINSTHIKLPINMTLNHVEPFKSDCLDWAHEEKDGVDLFIWEKDFYIQFLSTFAGIFIFINITHSAMMLMKGFSLKNEVSILQLLKSFSLANMSLLLTLPMLVWGSGETEPSTRLVHYALVFLYMFAVFYNMFSVLYESPRFATIMVLLASNLFKYMITFHATPFIRKMIT
ncbi:protein ARV1 [Colias croceus]|uniref:protein ARV1 n=1 Tax=Colias crocea TaxID=72248 RepID=UPI001E27A077|nr:protein ARV1 [Colias croceus]